ncbi:MAG: GntR family transcriptional regulator [Rhodobacteraceae bacterium]|jgi:DNA-binding GntR family transcriptional regulator|uniref:GntR family transcriptional regulator n=1 Tax=Salipiger TaxID=263377 RepID=UPI0008F0F0E5|nr:MULTISPECIES: GntR family transcriptional regulator [Salipiger]MAB05714.1 GntR family transcriptional regulator [Paracoccaceae bacterium]GGA08972.1 GntR family transcriptional regulator [Salipiger profundus]SFC57343.1 transcriptional regulator, GntR family [Salipiger profundus]HCR95458.1 GntR family transcriptional regulator [Oceanicaulis sp.]
MVNLRAENAGLPTHEVVYRTLRDMILFGELEPGQPVTIQGLVDRLDAGMTPVREALRRLIAEGALMFQGNRRIIVPVLDLDAVEELGIARIALEPQLARRAAQRCDAAAVTRLRATDARLDAAIRKGDVRGYLVENHQFHAELNEIACAPILTDLVEGLWLRFGPSLRVVCGQFGTRNLPDQHKAILDALEAADPEAAAEAMRADVEQGMTQISAGLS